MQPALRVNLFEDYSDGPLFIEDLTPHVVDIVLSAGLHGGVRGLEIILGRERGDSFLLAHHHIGKRLIVVDGEVEVVAEGTVTTPSIVEEGNRITCLGPFLDLCFRQVYNDTASWVSSGTTSEQIKDMLTDECPAISSDQSEIEETSTDNYPWQTAEDAYPGDLIPRLAAMSDSSQREWYFYLRSQPLKNGKPREPVACFKPQDLTTVHFWFDRLDCPYGGLEISPSLLELANDVRVMYRDSAGVSQQTGSAIDAESKDEYWLREMWRVPSAVLPTTVAEQYRDMYLARYKGPQQSISFRINGWIKNQWGIRQPLWKVIQEFPCNIGIRNLFPQDSIVENVDKEQVFSVAAARYSYASNTLIVTPDLEERTMENLLAMWTGAG